MDSNKIFRAIGCQACLCNGSALISLFSAWVLSGLCTANLLPNIVAWMIIFLLPVLGTGIWLYWKYEYQSETPALAERFYRNLALIIGIGGYILGLIHFM